MPELLDLDQARAAHQAEVGLVELELEALDLDQLAGEGLALAGVLCYFYTGFIT